MQNKNRFIKIWFMIQLMFVDQSEQKLLNFLIQKHSMSSHCKYKDFLRPRRPRRVDDDIRPSSPGWGRNLIYNFKMGIQRTGQGQDSSPYNGRNGLGLKTFYDCNFYWKWYFWSSRKSRKNFQKDFPGRVTLDLILIDLRWTVRGRTLFSSTGTFSVYIDHCSF